MSKHTPGPFKIGPATRTRRMDPDTCIEVQDARGQMIALLYTDNRAEGVDAANARLLAASAQLADALRHLADRVEQIELADGSTPDTLEARSVLALLDEKEES